MTTWEVSMESTRRRNETVSFTLAAGLHLLLLLLNPSFMKSELKPIHDLVSVEIVESDGGGSPIAPAPVKQSLLSSLKDMLMTPKTDQLAHVAPQPVRQVAAPVQPTLKEATRRPVSMNFTPKSQSEELAALSNPEQIKAPGPKLADMPVGGPTLQSKSFGGIRPKDLPFQVSGPESISAGQVSNIPIAIGNASAKSGLGYTGPSLSEASKRRVGIVPGASGTGASNDTMALASASPAPITVSGTGGTGTSATGATSGGGSLSQRSGRGGYGGGTGTGIGRGIGSGIEGGMPGAASALDAQLSKGSGGAEKTMKRKGFEIAGPLTNRPIAYKVIPEYPAWAEEQGIMGSVRLYFTVDSAGNVRSNIRVTKTTGHPALDQLGIDALKQWKFAPLGSAEEGTGQWGIITFNFSLSAQ